MNKFGIIFLLLLCSISPMFALEESSDNNEQEQQLDLAKPSELLEPSNIEVETDKIIVPASEVFVFEDKNEQVEQINQDDILKGAESQAVQTEQIEQEKSENTTSEKGEEEISPPEKENSENTTEEKGEEEISPPEKENSENTTEENQEEENQEEEKLNKLVPDNNNETEPKVLSDELADSLFYLDIEQPKTNLNYDYQSTLGIPIHLRISQPISTKEGIYDGMPLFFKIERDVSYNGSVIISKDLIVSAKVASFVTGDENGIPACIIVDGFQIPGIEDSKLCGVYTKYGKSLMQVALPLKCLLTPFPPLGTLTNPIHGKHAQITPNDIITIYYYPEWNKKPYTEY